MLNKIAAFIIARNGSSRLPGKALLAVNGKSVLEQIYHRINASPEIHEVWFVTSDSKADDSIEELARKLKINCFRGHREDIVDRMYHACLQTQCDLIIEVGGDCPLVDPHLINLGVREFEKSKADFTSNCFFKPFTFPVGYDIVLIKKTALMKLHNLAKMQSERRQPFQYIVRHPEEFKTAHICHHENLNHWRWTLDYPEDLVFMQEIFSRLQPVNEFFDFHMIAGLVRKFPEINSINERYAESLGPSTIWHTGSYISEMYHDINLLISLAIQSDQERNWKEAMLNYSLAIKYIQDLFERAEYFDANLK